MFNLFKCKCKQSKKRIILTDETRSVIKGLDKRLARIAGALEVIANGKK